jgi:hypothetical protein
MFGGPYNAHSNSMHHDDPVFAFLLSLFSFGLIIGISWILKLLVTLLSVPMLFVGTVWHAIIRSETVSG